MNRKDLITRYSPLLAFLALAIGVSYAFNVSTDNRTAAIVEAQIESCERVNLLRHEVNDTVVVVQSFLNEARLARINSGTPEDLQTAKKYLALQDKLDQITIPDCREVVTK